WSNLSHGRPRPCRTRGRTSALSLAVSAGRQRPDAGEDFGREEIDRRRGLGRSHVAEHQPADEIVAAALGDMALDLLADARARAGDGDAALAGLVEVAGEPDRGRSEIAPELGQVGVP